MRKSFNGLWSEVSEQLKEDPFSGALFVFTNKPKKMSRMVFKSGAIGQVVFRQPLENEIRQHH